MKFPHALYAFPGLPDWVHSPMLDITSPLLKLPTNGVMQYMFGGIWLLSVCFEIHSWCVCISILLSDSCVYVQSYPLTCP